jgi:hypothetical protein
MSRTLLSESFTNPTDRLTDRSLQEYQMTASKLIAVIAVAFPLVAFSATAPASNPQSAAASDSAPAAAGSAPQSAPAAQQPRAHAPRSKADAQAYKEHGVKMSTCRDRATASGLRDEAFKTAVADCMK